MNFRRPINDWEIQSLVDFFGILEQLIEPPPPKIDCFGIITATEVLE